MTKEMRAKDLETLPGLRRRVVDLELENNKYKQEIERLRALVPRVYCRECKCARCPDGIFIRCSAQKMRVVSPSGFCDEGRPRNGQQQKDPRAGKQTLSSY